MASYVKGFQGNQRVRPAGTPIEWDAEKLSEFKRCSEDPLHFISNYVWILNLDSEQLVLFKPRRYQVEMLETVLANRFTVSKWGRQMGKSVIVSAILLWLILFNSNYPVLVLAHKHEKAREILAVIESMYEHLPEWLQHGVKTWSKGTIELENGSSIKTAGTSGSSGRGGTYQCIFLDEMAFVPSHIADEFMKSVLPTISSGRTTKVVATSTPKGLNSFYRLWTDAVNHKNEFKTVDVNWWEAPGRDEEFKRKTIEAYGEDYWAQEFASSFIGSSRTLIRGDKLASLVTERPVHVSDCARVYSEAEAGHSYAATVDVAEGLGGDYSAIVVFDITRLPYRVVAVYKNNLIQPMALPGVIHEMATVYNNALVLVEANFGGQVGEILYQEFEYENVVWTKRGGSRDEMGEGGDRIGLAWTNASKRVGCSNLKTLVEQDQLVISDQWIYDELTRFVVKKKSYAAEDGHDDLCMCLVLFAWMVDQGYVRDSTSVDVRNRVAELNRQAIESQMIPLGFSLDGTETDEEEMIMAPSMIDIPYGHEEHRFDDLLNKAKSRHDLTESQLHDLFMRQFLADPTPTTLDDS